MLMITSRPRPFRVPAPSPWMPGQADGHAARAPLAATGAVASVAPLCANRGQFWRANLRGLV
jgi:hypothetical protein